MFVKENSESEFCGGHAFSVGFFSHQVIRVGGIVLAYSVLTTKYQWHIIYNKTVSDKVWLLLFKNYFRFVFASPLLSTPAFVSPFLLLPPLSYSSAASTAAVRSLLSVRFVKFLVVFFFLGLSFLAFLPPVKTL